MWLIWLCQQESLNGFKAYGRNFENFKQKASSRQSENTVFTDNAPSHPKFFIDSFSYGKIDFFPKHTISTLQSLDTGIIKKFEYFTVNNCYNKYWAGLNQYLSHLMWLAVSTFKVYWMGNKRLEKSLKKDCQSFF